MHERRRYVRIRENSQISYEVLPGENRKEYATKDISQGGIKFLTHEFIPKGSRLKIKLSLYKTFFNFEALVRCAWVNKIAYNEEYEVGVEFIDIPSTAAEHLISYIEAFVGAQDNGS